MSDFDEKAPETITRDGGFSSPQPEIVGEESKIRGKAWMYKRPGFGRFRMAPYASPQFQVAFVAIVCFLCPGMFNAINGLGAAGQVNAHDIDNANSALYACFSIVGFFAGSIANLIGLRLTLGVGGFGYFLYIGSLLSYNHNQNVGFLLFAATILGICAGLLWTAQGAIMLSYPPEESKGKYISWFWMIFNLGAVVGALIPLGQNINNTSKGTVNDGTYIAFMVIMASGFILACLLCNPKFVERADGSHVILMKNPTWKSELRGLVSVFKSEPWIVMLFPAFFVSNWFYTYQFQDFNLPVFNVRTRSLNNVLYWLMQIVGAYVTGYALDTKFFSRSMRAKLCWGYLLVLTLVIWGGGYDFQKQYTRPVGDEKPAIFLDWTDNGYVGPMFLYMFYGYFDAAWQTSMYWYMGSISNNARKLAYFAGFYKGIQSAGSALSPILDSKKLPYKNIFFSNWGLLLGSLVLAAPILFTKVTDHTSLEKDLAFSDETASEVVATGSEVHGDGHVVEK